MDYNQEHLRGLLNRFAQNDASEAEVREMLAGLREEKGNPALESVLADLFAEAKSNPSTLPVDWEKVWNHVAKGTYQAPVKKMNWTRIAAAAIIVGLLSVSSYFYFSDPSGKEIAGYVAPKALKNDVTAPQTNKAILTLSDGSTILLDSAGNGELAVQGNVKVEKTPEGQIVYKGNATEIKMNTITVPKGSRPLRLQLADGSNVWLNVASSITYPTAFEGATRKVQITGEAYFEVAHNATMPFIVEKNEVSVQVLGTRFNVNSYDNEAAMRITLLEGSVKVQKGNAAGLLKPGQQAVIGPGDKERIKVVSADVDLAVAWKNGLFNFEGAHLDEVMRQLERWYDIEVVYENGIPDIEFVGKMSKNMDLNDLLEILKKTKVQFKLADGRKLVVKN